MLRHTPRLSVTHKLAFTLLLANAVVVGVTLVWVNWSFERGFIQFLQARQTRHVQLLSQRLAELYRSHGHWDRVRAHPQYWLRAVLDTRGPRGNNTPTPAPKFEQPSPLLPPRTDHPPNRHPPWHHRLILLDSTQQLVAGRPLNRDKLDLSPIQVDGKTVGYLGVQPGPPLPEWMETRFLRAQIRSYWLIGAVMLVVSLGLAWPLARRLLRPVRTFASASQAVAAGDFKTRLPIHSNDELGQLAYDFNRLVATLERNETQRRQWLADVSHELRTPLALLRGELEALQDGVRTFDDQTVAMLLSDVMRLNHLVDDLYQLSLSDLGALDYHWQLVDLCRLLKKVIERLRPAFTAQQLQLDVIWPHQYPCPFIRGDAGRLAQLFRNLLSNSLRYTAAGGQVQMATSYLSDQYIVTLTDSAPGVDEADLPRLFDRFFRVERSRTRATGGAGLGLTICRSIVAAHGGHITAAPSSLGGLCIRVVLPR